MSLNKYFPDGTGDHLSGVARHIKQREKADKPRRDSARQRRRLFDCMGFEQALTMIDELFADLDVRKLRKDVAPYARFQNPLRRLVCERARAYAKPPKRTVNNATDDTYQRLQRMTQHNRAMRLADELTDLQNDTFWLFRVRETPAGREPRTDIIGPEDFFIITDPHDHTKLLAVGYDRHPLPGADGKAAINAAHWTVWSPWESFELDGHGGIIPGSASANPFGRIPGLLVHNGYRSQQLLDPYTGEDRVAAHLTAWLLNTMMVKEAKSLNRQAAFTGETGRSPTGQSQDSERDMILAEGVGVTTIDRGVDLKQYLEAADHVIERVAADYGIPPSVLRHAGATSGHEIDLRRIPLEELREDRIAIFRDAEREYAEIQAAVLKLDMPELSFSTDGWSMDYAEIKRPLPQSELYSVRKAKRSMGHSDPVLEAMEDNPDFTEEMAIEWVEERMARQQEFIDAARARSNIPSDATVEDPGRSPQENGADNQQQDDEQAEEPADA